MNHKEVNLFTWCRSVSTETFGDVLFRVGLDDDDNPVLRISVYSENIVSSFFVENVKLNYLEQAENDDLLKLIDGATCFIDKSNFKPSKNKGFKIIESENELFLTTLDRDNSVVIVFESDREFFETSARPDLPLNEVHSQVIRSLIKLGVRKEEPIL